MKLSGKNFQPWPEFDLEISGLTVLIGPSNEGKSSIYRALKGILRNEVDEAQIRDPKEEPLELTLKVGDYTVTAVRGKKGSVRYEVDHPSFTKPEKPKKYAKLDGTLPPEVRALNFGEIKIGEYSIDPIFGDQNRPQFLIDPVAYKPGHINAVLGAFGGTEKLERGKKEANLRKTQKDGEAKLLAGQIRDAEQRKHGLDGLLEAGEPLSGSLRALEKEIQALEAEALWVGRALSCRKRLHPLRQLSESFVLPDVGDIQRLQQASQQANEAAESSAFARWLRKPLVAIEGIVTPWSAILGLWKQIKTIYQASGVLSEARIDITGLKPLVTLGGGINELLGLQSSIRHMDAAFTLRQELAALIVKLADIDAQLAAAQEEVRKGLCPRCGRPLEHVCV
jgi:energy-coupling factor transporter ATP-binding protein EcfA2